MSAATIIQEGTSLGKTPIGWLFRPYIKEVGTLYDFSDTQFAPVMLSNGVAALMCSRRMTDTTASIWEMAPVRSKKRWINEAIGSSCKMPEVECASRDKLIIRTFHNRSGEEFERIITLCEAIGGEESDVMREAP